MLRLLSASTISPLCLLTNPIIADLFIKIFGLGSDLELHERIVWDVFEQLGASFPQLTLCLQGCHLQGLFYAWMRRTPSAGLSRWPSLALTVASATCL